MPPLILAGLLGVGLYVGIRVASGLLNAMDEGREAYQPAEPTPTDADPSVAKDLGPLELDPQTGVYRPSRRN